MCDKHEGGRLTRKLAYGAPRQHGDRHLVLPQHDATRRTLAALLNMPPDNCSRYTAHYMYIIVHVHTNIILQLNMQ